MNILLTAILLVNLAFLVVIIIALVKIRAVYAEFVAFISPKGENLPSPAAELFSSMSESLANNLMLKARATIMGISSGISRGESAVDNELLNQANPVIGTLMGLPGLKKIVKKNPALLQYALSKFGGSSAPVVAAGDDRHSSPKFKL